MAIVIFGVTGDLAARKLVPALYELELAERLPTTIYVIGFARRDWDLPFMRQHFQKAVEEYARNKPIQHHSLDLLLGSMHYLRSNFNDQAGYHRLAPCWKNLV